MNIIDDKFDIAINLAAQAGVRVHSDMSIYIAIQILMALSLFCNFCKQMNINKIIYASSSSVYSDSEDTKYQEIYTKLKPKSLYGSSVSK